MSTQQTQIQLMCVSQFLSVTRTSPSLSNAFLGPELHAHSAQGNSLTPDGQCSGARDNFGVEAVDTL